MHSGVIFNLKKELNYIIYRKVDTTDNITCFLLLINLWILEFHGDI